MKYDWLEAMDYANNPTTVLGDSTPETGYGQDDVDRILVLDNGENDTSAWIAVFKLKDGRYAFLTAWCDCTGWDCQAVGNSRVSYDLDNLIRYGMSREDRERLHTMLAEDLLDNS